MAVKLDRPLSFPKICYKQKRWNEDGKHELVGFTLTTRIGIVSIWLTDTIYREGNNSMTIYRYQK